jgi:GTP-binding protein Era
MKFSVNPAHKSIMVSLIGVPNAGKSSLVNNLIGIDLSIVTNREQTTRNKFNCVFTVDDTEVILVDTPGLHRSSKEINKRMNEQAREGARETDLNLILIDLTRGLKSQFEDLNHSLRGELARSWIVFTKCDLIKGYADLPLSEVVEEAKELFPMVDRFFVVSSKTDENIHELVGALCDEAPQGPHLYPHGNISDKSERFFVTEYIREQAFELLKDEIPYEVAVVIEEYKDILKMPEEDERELKKPRRMAIDYSTALLGQDVRKTKEELEAEKLLESEEPVDNNKGEVISHISAAILVNRPSQRAIVVGSKGSMIKEIGTRARKKIEMMTGHRVFLNLHVKVSPKWFKNNFVLEEIGLPRVHDSARVWKRK